MICVTICMLAAGLLMFAVCGILYFVKYITNDDDDDMFNNDMSKIAIMGMVGISIAVLSSLFTVVILFIKSLI